MHSRATATTWLFAAAVLMTSVGCEPSSPQEARRARAPLYVGQEAKGELVCTEPFAGGPGARIVPFRVDVSALGSRPETQELWKNRGSWKAVELANGWLVGLHAGEWGGLAQWYSKTGSLLATLQKSEPLVQFIYDDEVLLCLTGIRHLAIDEGHIWVFKRNEAGWKRLAIVPLPGAPTALTVEEDGSFTIQLWKGRAVTYRSGLLVEKAAH